MRTGDARALAAFTERFYSVLVEDARLAGVPQGNREELATDVLSAVALELLAPGRSTPQNPRIYLIAVLRHRLFHDKHGYAQRDVHLTALLRDAVLDFDYADEREVVGGLSEHTVRESRGPERERAPLAQSLKRLATHLDNALSVEERELMIAVGENIPRGRIAEWLGLSHATVRKRLQRLRARLTQVTTHYIATIASGDARAVQRFLGRRLSILIV